MYPYMIHSRRRRGGGGSPSFVDVILPVAAFSVVMGGLIIGQDKLKEEEKKKYPTYNFNDENQETKVFAPGEHIMSVLIDSPLEEAQQYEYHPGYKPIGIASATYGKYEAHDSGSCILYVNDYPVEVKSNGIKDDEAYFSSFGTPIDYTYTEKNESTYTIDFAPGEHILSIPIDDPTNYDSQFMFYEGYEPVGIATASYGKYDDNSSGSCMLYVNTQTVTLDKNENNEYIEFGTPKEEAKVKIK